MSALALPDDDGAGMQIAQVRAARQWLRDATDAQDVAGLAEKAKFAHDVFKIAKKADALAQEALQLQAEALHRLARLDALDLLPKRGLLRSTAGWLGDMADAEFAQFVESIEPWSSITGRYKAHLKDVQMGRYRDEWGDIQHGRPLAPDRDFDRRQWNVAQTVLLDMAAQEDSFSTADAALALAEAIGLDCDRVDDVRREGLEQIIRTAISEERSEGVVVEADGRSLRCPRFVTYQEDPFGWVRVPWDRATLPQLQFMAEYRSQQAADLMRSSADLAVLVGEATRRQRENPSEQRLVELLGEVDI